MSAALQVWQVRLSSLRNDCQAKGLRKGLINFTYEWYFKRQFRKMGIVFPDFSNHVQDTVLKSIHHDAHENQESSFFLVNKAFYKIPLRFSDIHLLDIGCGSGKAMVMGMKHGFKEVSGVDLDLESLEQAEHNCAKMREYGSDTKYHLHTGDASVFRIPDGVNLVYLFNPFGILTLRQVLDNIHAYSKKTEAPVYVIYLNPKHDFVFSEMEDCRKIYSSFFRASRPEMNIYRIG